jgi:hypothetical protein
MTDLTDKLRTCAAYILGRAKEGDPWALEFVSHDTADLLIEASNVLEMAPEPLGEPMAILAAMPTTVTPTSIDPPDKLVEQHKAATGWAKPNPVPRAVWTTNAGDLPPVPTGKPSKRPPRVCPQCDSRAVKKVYREGSKLMLACPVCSAGWEYQP